MTVLNPVREFLRYAMAGQIYVENFHQAGTMTLFKFRGTFP